MQLLIVIQCLISSQSTRSSLQYLSFSSIWQYLHVNSICFSTPFRISSHSLYRVVVHWCWPASLSWESRRSIGIYSFHHQRISILLFPLIFLVVMMIIVDRIVYIRQMETNLMRSTCHRNSQPECVRLFSIPNLIAFQWIQVSTWFLDRFFLQNPHTRPCSSHRYTPCLWDTTPIGTSTFMPTESIHSID